MEYSPKKMQQLLNKHNFNFKKMYGQNFIIDENIIQNIVNKSFVDKNTTVIEIGPGAGSLTNYLSKSAKNILCYEVDENLKPILMENIDNSNVNIIFSDFLERDILEDLKKYSFQKLYVVANLPYYITTPIIMKIIRDKIPVDKIVVMVQKEVGERFRATPNSKDYNSLSIYLQYYFTVHKLLDVSRNVFLPKPNVDSVVVEFVKHNHDYGVRNETLFFSVVRDSFKQKRKNLRNNLKAYDLTVITEVLKEYKLDLNVRAEQLTIEQFVAISNRLSEK